jgi:hypothetical protein
VAIAEQRGAAAHASKERARERDERHGEDTIDLLDGAKYRKGAAAKKNLKGRRDSDGIRTGREKPSEEIRKTRSFLENQRMEPFKQMHTHDCECPARVGKNRKERWRG